MIPSAIAEYLRSHAIPFERRPHDTAPAAQWLAASLHRSGRAVAKSVLIQADGRTWIALLSGAEEINLGRLAKALGAASARLMAESEFEGLFPGCELGAEPPFGHLYSLPVVMDRALLAQPRLLMRAGSHQEAVEMSLTDFIQLEAPRVAIFGVSPEFRRAEEAREAHA